MRVRGWRMGRRTSGPACSVSAATGVLGTWSARSVPRQPRGETPSVTCHPLYGGEDGGPESHPDLVLRLKPQPKPRGKLSRCPPTPMPWGSQPHPPTDQRARVPTSQDPLMLEERGGPWGRRQHRRGLGRSGRPSLFPWLTVRIASVRGALPCARPRAQGGTGFPSFLFLKI